MGCNLMKILINKLLFILLLISSIKTYRIDFNSKNTLSDFKIKHQNYYNIKEMRKTIIEGLGLKNSFDLKKMNVSQEEYTKKYNEYLRYLRKRISDGKRDNSSIPEFHTLQQKELRFDRISEGILQLSFEEPVIEENSIIDNANVRMLIEGVNEDAKKRIKVYGISSNEKHRKKYLIDDKEVYLSERYPKWIEFDVTKALHHWQKDPSLKNVNIEIHCIRCIEEDISFYPILPTSLNVLVKTFSKDRDRRSTDKYYRNERKTDCTPNNNKKCCSRQEMIFDISKLKESDFIIQPKKFDAGICRGRCPPRFNAAHNHAIFQALLWKKNKNLVPRVCCAPNKLESLEILTIDEDDPTKLKVTDYKNMIVTECWCS